MQRRDSPTEAWLEEQKPDKAQQHYKNWPNAAGFNAIVDTRTPIDLAVTGSFPSYVAGSLYRTGPGGYKVPRANSKDGTFEASHWFDGFTMVHKFDLVSGADGNCSQVRYTSHSEVDERIEKARQTGRLDDISFGQKRDPCDTLFRKLKTVFTQTSTSSPAMANTGVTLRRTLPQETKKISINGTPVKDTRQVITLQTDASSLKQIDAETLEPLGVCDQSILHPKLKGPISAAHPSKDPITGEIFNYNLEFGPKPVYRVWRSSSDGKVDILAEISGADAKASYLHSLHLTPNFVILCIWPAQFQAGGASVLWNRNFLDSLTFDASASSTWFVIDRHHQRGVVKKFQSPSMFVFHTTNAWEEPCSDTNEVDIVCEQVEFANMDILYNFYYKYLVSDASEVATPAADAYRASNATLSLARHKLASIPLTQSSTTSSTTSKSLPTTSIITRIPTPKAGELPTYNPTFTFRPHRYIYSILARDKASFADGLGKTDAATGECAVWECQGHTPGEPIFVPALNGKIEDEGVLLSVVLDGWKGTSYLLCLDARTMREVGRAEVGKAVGFGFHGMHVGKY